MDRLLARFDIADRNGFDPAPPTDGPGADKDATGGALAEWLRLASRIAGSDRSSALYRVVALREAAAYRLICSPSDSEKRPGA
jgi:hypothetical protein